MNSPAETFSQKVINFFTNLKSPQDLPGNIKVLNPYKDEEVKKIVNDFYNHFFSDNNERVFILGINPGRFGGGVTGIPFTDPIVLEEYCGIKNSLNKKAELSSKFVYSFINEFGGVKKFYSQFFISAIYPLALLSDGKNYNYYDSKELYQHLKPYLISSLHKQINFGARKDIVICLGKKNFSYLNQLNKEINYFENITTLEHPRFIMQYRLKKKDQYIQKYIDTLRSCY
ncbi:MAG: DUF4918 family protein [Ignavibacteria bacterium]|nr:DUF4918 family protein [Ignavibacteria bacterium]